MLSWDRGDTLADRFRSHAGAACHLYGHAMRGMADDWEAGGPVRTICAGYEQAPPGSALPLRLLAGVFRLVLTDQAPELVPFLSVSWWPRRSRAGLAGAALGHRPAPR